MPLDLGAPPAAGAVDQAGELRAVERPARPGEQAGELQPDHAAAAVPRQPRELDAAQVASARRAEVAELQAAHVAVGEVGEGQRHARRARRSCATRPNTNLLRDGTPPLVSTPGKSDRLTACSGGDAGLRRGGDRSASARRSRATRSAAGTSATSCRGDSVVCWPARRSIAGLRQPALVVEGHPVVPGRQPQLDRLRRELVDLRDQLPVGVAHEQAAAQLGREDQAGGRGACRSVITRSPLPVSWKS